MNHDVCPHCGWEIDTDCCWCGSSTNGHPYDVGHSFVPMGCTCGYVDAKERRNEAYFITQPPPEARP